MIDVKKAIQAASEYMRLVYEKPSDIRLEEVWLMDGPPQEWHVTLSFIQELMRREYKQFDVDATTGQVKAMRIRQIA